MITVTNEKVAGFEPRWARFRGFSLLFDNPGRSLSPGGGLLRVDCRVGDDPALRLYAALAGALEDAGGGALLNAYLFCALPPSSYHVTAWDGGNDGNARRVSAPHRAEFEGFLEGLPGSARAGCALTRAAAESALAATPGRPLSFKFEGLVMWGRQVLAARLAPAGAGSTDALERIVRDRAALSAHFRGAFGVAPGDDYAPHVSLGYFANRESAELAAPRLGEWAELARARAGGLTVTFGAVGLYAFTDMAHFYKV